MGGLLDELSRPDAHQLVSGMSGSGKSHLVLAVGDKWPGPVLFWNPQDDVLASHWTHADRSNDSADLFRNARGRVSYVPNFDTKFAAKEARAIVNHLMRPLVRHRLPVLIIFDEADLIAPEGKTGTPVHEVVQRGRKLNVWGILVTQFPSLISKVVARNCHRQLYFWSEYAEDYYNRQKLPGAHIVQTLEDAPDHSFMIRDRRGLTGPYKL